MGIGEKTLEAMQYKGSLTSEYSRYCSGQTELEIMTPNNRIVYILNEANRELGLYRNASIITKELSSLSKLDMMLIYERQASDASLTGSWLAARKKFLKALQYGIFHLGGSPQFDSIYVETFRAYIQLCRDIGRLPVIGRQLMNRYIAYPVDLISSNNQLQEILSRSPYDRAHIAKLFAWECNALRSIKRRLPAFLLDESLVVQVFGETDNVLGIINATRSRLLSELSQGLIPKKNEILRLLILSKNIGDNPGIVKASRILVFLGYFNKRTFIIFVNSLINTQWITARKCYESIMFLSSICIGCIALTKRSTRSLFRHAP